MSQRIVLLAIFLGFNCWVIDPALGAQAACESFESAWSQQEREAWATLCENGRLAFGQSSQGSTQSNAERISSSFLENILTSSPYRERFKSVGVQIDGASVSGPLKLQNRMVEGSLLLTNCRFENLVDLSRSRFSGSVSFVGSTLAEGINIKSSRIDGSFFIGGSDQPTSNGDVNYPLVKIEHIDLSGTNVEGDLDVLDADIEHSSTLLHTRVSGSINLFRLKAHRIILTSSEVRGQLNLVASTLGATTGSPARNEPPTLNLYSVRVLQDLHLNRTRVDGTTLLANAELTGSLTLLGASLGDVEASGMTVKNSVDVGYNDRRPLASGQTTWDTGARLDLSNTNIGFVSTPLNLSYWPGSINLDGARIGSFNFGLFLSPTDAVVGPLEVGKEASWLLSWLERTSFAPQTYSRIKATLIANGSEEIGNQVGSASRDRELVTALQRIRSLEPSVFFSSLNSAIYLFSSKILIGYGYNMLLPIVWTLLFVTLGAAVFRLSPEAKKEGMPYGFSYSFDTFLPLIKLREKHYEIDLQTTWARYYFYFHKLFGWVVGSFIVVGLSGLTK